MRKLLNNNYFILLPILFLNVISLLYLYNSSFFIKQLIFIIIGLICLLVVSKINIIIIKKYYKLFYFLTSFLLLLVLIFGKEINGSKAWISLLGFNIQPSELAKISLILMSCFLCSKKVNLFYFILIFIIPSILTFLEPDTGAIIIYLIIFLSCLNYIKISKKNIIIISLLLIAFIISNITIYFIFPALLIKIYGTKLFYRIDRLISFRNQNNIQIVNSLIAIGSHKLIYIPENHNDFIFSALVSKYSILIFIIIIISYGLILMYFINRYNKKNKISNIFNFIILNILFFQIFYNILMNLSLLPIIGIPLPFLSYGGTFMVSSYVIIGLAINLNKTNKVYSMDMVDKDMALD